MHKKFKQRIDDDDVDNGILLYRRALIRYKENYNDDKVFKV